MNDSCHDIYDVDTCPMSTGERNQCDDTAPIFGPEPGGNPTLPTGISELGLYHTAGNVWEWVSDDAGQDQGLFRGGGWNDAAAEMVAWSEQQRSTDYARMTVGFRCAVGVNELTKR